MVRGRIFVAVVALGLIASACSGSDDPGDAVQGEPTPTEAPALPTDSEATELVIGDGMFAEIEARLQPNIPALVGSDQVDVFQPTDMIRLGGVVTETIDGLPIRPGICAGAKARLDGAVQRDESEFTFDWIGCVDDSGFVDRTDSAMDRLRFEDPFAVVPLDSARFTAETALTDAQIPYVGSGGQPVFCGVERGFGFAPGGAAACPVLDVLGITTSGPVLQAWATATGTDPAGLRVAHIVDGSVSGRERARSRALEVEQLGAEMVLVDSTIAFAASATDEELAATSAALLPLDIDVVIVELAGADAVYPFIAAAGFSGAVVGVDLDPALLEDDPALAQRLQGTFQVVPSVAVVSDGSAGWAQLESDAQDLLGSAEGIGLGFVQGYVAMDFFLAALATIEGPVDQLRFHDAINRGWTYPGIDGVACASDWPAAHLLAAPCASVVAVDGSGILTSMLGPTPFPLLLLDTDG